MTEPMPAIDVHSGASALDTLEEPTVRARRDERVRALIEAQYGFIWRSLRRLGVPEADVDDSVQRVFLIAVRRLEDIRTGSERPFLYQTAIRVASDSRRTHRRRREVDASHADSLEDPRLPPDELVEMRRARQTLDQVLDGMSIELRAVFVLFELEQMTLTEIASLLAVPRGTVASRLRRARIDFYQRLRSIQPNGSGEEP